MSRCNLDGWSHVITSFVSLQNRVGENVSFQLTLSYRQTVMMTRLVMN